MIGLFQIEDGDKIRQLIDGNGTGTGSSEIPVATSTVLGGVKPNDGLTVDTNGVLKVDTDTIATVATVTALQGRIAALEDELETVKNNSQDQLAITGISRTAAGIVFTRRNGTVAYTLDLAWIEDGVTETDTTVATPEVPEAVNSIVMSDNGITFGNVGGETVYTIPLSFSSEIESESTNPIVSIWQTSNGIEMRDSDGGVVTTLPVNIGSEGRISSGFETSPIANIEETDNGMTFSRKDGTIACILPLKFDNGVT